MTHFDIKWLFNSQSFLVFMPLFEVKDLMVMVAAANKISSVKGSRLEM